MTIKDYKLQVDFLCCLINTSTYDLTEAKRIVESCGIQQLDFDSPDNWICYRGITSCVIAGLPCTPDNLCREIAAIAGDRAANITKTVISSSDGSGIVDGYLSKLLEVSEKRQTLQLLEDYRTKLAKGFFSPNEVKHKLSQSLFRTRGRKSTTGLDEHVKELEDNVIAINNGTASPVIPWYIPALDKVIGGLQRTLTIIGAEPGVGKSALIASGVSLQAKNGHRPCVITLEDPPDWLAYRAVSNDSKINQFQLRFQKLDKMKIEQLKGINELLKEERKRIRIIDGSDSSMKIEDIISSIKDAIRIDGCDSIWLDHMGQIALTSSERTDLEITKHYSMIRGIANEFGVPVIVAAHFKRIQVAPGQILPPPSYRDFANSSGAERKARVALGLRRNPGSDMLQVHVMKQTNGAAGGVVNLEFGGAAAMIVNVQGGIGNGK